MIEVDIPKAIEYIKGLGDEIELARLGYLVSEQSPASEIAKVFRASQQPDGGWEAFWVEDYGSLDKTCFRFSQAQQLGLSFDLPWIRAGLDFLRERQLEDGSWEEDRSVKDRVPRWLKPGDISTRLYLTANCGFWLGWAGGYREEAQGAADYLIHHLDDNGHLPSFPHTHWLAAGLLYRLWMKAPSKRIQIYLTGKLGVLSGSNLAWLITALRIVNIPKENHLFQQGISRLVRFQRSDGSWGSDDGEGFDVHATLEALYALKLCGFPIE
jgi:hypothetical protein